MRLPLFLSAIVLLLVLAQPLLAQRPVPREGDAPFFDAAARGDLDQVKALLTADPTLAKAVNRRRQTALFLAAQKARADVVEYLLGQGADVDQRDPVDGAALHVAAKAGDLRIVELLLAKKPAINFPAHLGTPLLQAAGGGHLAVVERLVKEGAQLEVRHNFLGTALEHALASDRTAVARFLAMQGAGPRSALGEPPLRDDELRSEEVVGRRVNLVAATIRTFCLDCANGELARVRAAVELLPDLSKKLYFPGFQFPIASAAEGERVEIMAFLLARGFDPHHGGKAVPIEIAVRKGNRELIKLLYAAGIRLDERPAGGRFSPANQAIEQKNGDLLIFLLELGVSPDVPDGREQNPLHFAAGRGDLAMVRLLLGRGARVDGPPRAGGLWEPPLSVAVAAGHKEVVSLLLGCGADPTLPTPRGAIPELAAGREEIVSLLAAHGRGEMSLFARAARGDLAGLKEAARRDAAALEVRDTEGNSLLHAATLRGRLEVAAWLLSKGADANLKNAEGRTPLHLAAMSPAGPPLAELLVNHKTELSPLDAARKTPLDYARLTPRETRQWLLAQGARFGPGVRVEPPVRAVRPKGIVFRGWRLFPGGSYEIQSKEGHYSLRNQNGLPLQTLEFDHRGQRVKVTVDQSTVPSVTVSEMVGGNQASIQYKDLREFRDKSRERYDLFDALLLKAEQGMLAGAMILQGDLESAR